MVKKIKSLLLGLLLIGGVSITSTQKAYAWNSVNDVNTMDSHKTISVQALEIIKNDMPNDSKLLKNLNIIEQNLNLYKKGSVAPDFGKTGVDKDYSQYQDHFFNPYTGKNYTYESWWYLPEKIDDTAESQTRNYVSQAIGQWKDGNYEQACYTLGKATHYFADLNEPHHASNLTALNPNSGHSKFEKYVDTIANKLLINTIGDDKSEYNVDSTKCLTDFLTTQSYKYAKLAYAQSSNVLMTNSWDDWNKAADICFKNAERGTATVVYRFLKEITYGGQAVKPPIGKFHVVIKTANDSYAGTNDYIYFGMELNDGRKKELYCNLPGDDFATGTTGCYEFEISDPTFDPTQVKNVWLRKANFSIRDDWKPETLQVYIQGTRVLNKTINQWIKNETYNIPVDGLK
ncbi:phospholipase C [Haloimpatiens sp. FM7330]|uniref:phospholipase C n=1 Tax=Haloimpatiens sp. FM7330 TaxID=3298610 RepID=UPI00363C69E6